MMRTSATEVDEKSIPHELDWSRITVHLSTGCYRGQETVAKVHNLGHPPRRLVMLYLDGSDTVPPSRGDDVVLGGKTVDQGTSAAAARCGGSSSDLTEDAHREARTG